MHARDELYKVSFSLFPFSSQRAIDISHYSLSLSLSFIHRNTKHKQRYNRQRHQLLCSRFTLPFPTTPEKPNHLSIILFHHAYIHLQFLFQFLSPPHHSIELTFFHYCHALPTSSFSSLTRANHFSSLFHFLHTPNQPCTGSRGRHSHNPLSSTTLKTPLSLPLSSTRFTVPSTKARREK